MKSGPLTPPFLPSEFAPRPLFASRWLPEAQAYRLVASEGDLLPSLIIDRYGDCFVIQTLSQGMERMKATVVEILQEEFAPRAILERNDVAVRGLEGLPEQSGVLAGEEVSEVVVEENGVKMCFDLLHGQKTGGFLDQRENRAAAASYAHGRALDCFTYTGGFALALAPHCDSVLGVDSSGDALRQAERSQESERIHQPGMEGSQLLRLSEGRRPGKAAL